MKEVSIKLSVIIPVYNAEGNLSQCLNSILVQTLKEIEIICVDDGSTDDSYRLLQAFQKNDSRIVVLQQENAGAGAARNLALTKAKGDYIAFMDADDWYPNSHILELLYQKAVQNNVWVCGGSFSEYKDGKVNTTYSGRYSLYTFEEEGFIDYTDFQFDYGYIRFIYNRAFLIDNDIKFPLYRRFQDPPFFVNVMVHAKRFYVVPEVVYCYRKGEKRVKWSDDKALDAVKGITDVLRMSKEYRLAKLHVAALERINIEYYSIVAKKIRPDNLEMIEQLLKTNKEVDVDLLIEAGYDIDRDKKYLIKLLRNSILFYNSNKSREQQVRQNKCKRFITYIPRKIIGGIRCVHDNGIRYTVKRTLEKIHEHIK